MSIYFGRVSIYSNRDRITESVVVYCYAARRVHHYRTFSIASRNAVASHDVVGECSSVLIIVDYINPLEPAVPDEIILY